MDKIKCIKFPKIGQFRNVLQDLNRQMTFIGMDDLGDPIYDHLKRKETLTFKGSVKLHGTNAAISYNDSLGIWAQSRERALNLTEVSEHFGFVFLVKSKESVIELMINRIKEENNIDTSIDTITIYGEWAGKGIQKGVAISNIDKALFIFGVKISRLGDENFKSYWVDSSNLSSPDDRIFNINDFQTFEIEIDMNNPKSIQNDLIDITLNVEKECPVSKVFGHSGVGEGVVWSVEYKDTIHRFKVKGDKHSSSNVPKLAEVDIEKMNSVSEFVDYAVTQNRFEQGIQIVFDGAYMSTKQTGDIIRWVIEDIMSEELDVLVENNLIPKDVNKSISDKVRKLFFVEIAKQDIV